MCGNTDGFAGRRACQLYDLTQSVTVHKVHMTVTRMSVITCKLLNNMVKAS